MDIYQRAKNWIDQDPDPVTRQELTELISRKSEQELLHRFSGKLEFGTAGLRGELGAGPNRMNRVVVARAAKAIAEFLIRNRSSYADSAGELSVVIGYDARINSDIFAKDSAEVFAAAGIKALLFDRAVPTPITAFSGKRHSASAAIMVTASHNPPKDNGYKVYLGGPNNHSQLISPADKEIAELIDEIGENYNFSEIPKSKSYQLLGEHEISNYVTRAIQLAPIAKSGIRICYTPLHGVGWDVTREIFQKLGFSNISVVEQQAVPDGSFPTVAFPNPEEKGAMDLAFATASAAKAEIIIAHDPDADRMAVAIPAENGWRMLTGDEVGLILGEEIAKNAKAGTLANSIVSSDQLAQIATAYQLDFQQTLTGFKWISKAKNLVFGFEEALGYCVDPEYTPDKDGITASVMILSIADRLLTQGKTLGDYLHDLADKYGNVASSQISLRVEDLSTIQKIMMKLREIQPNNLGGWQVRFEDLKLGNKLPSTDAVMLTASDIRLIIRPSGTEPKLKFYLLARGKSATDSGEKLEQLRDAANALLDALK